MYALTDGKPKFDQRQSPAYAIADALEAVMRSDDMAGALQDVRERWGSIRTTYLDSPWEWPKRVGTVGIWLDQRRKEVVVRWQDPVTGIKTSALRLLAE